jgi:hypothetical protein
MPTDVVDLRELRGLLTEVSRGQAQFDLARSVERTKRKLGAWYREQARGIVPRIERTLTTNSEAKRTASFRESVATKVDAIFDQEIRLLRGKGADALEGALINGYTSGFSVGRETLGIRTSFKLKHPDAVEWSKVHATERIVTVEGSTKDEVKAHVIDGLERGKSPREIGRTLRGYFEHKEKSHSLTVARTETAFGYESGNRKLISELQEAGLDMEKAWHRTGSEDCDICEDNENEGFIDADEDHASGDPHPPGHPNCLCWEEYQRKDGDPVDEEELSGEEDWAPATSQKEVADRAAAVAREYNLGEFDLSTQNSLLRAMEDVLGKNNVRVTRVGPQTRPFKSDGTYWPGTHEIQFQKTALRDGMVKKQKSRAQRFPVNQASKVREAEKSIERARTMVNENPDPRSSAYWNDYIVQKEKLVRRLKAPTRWDAIQVAKDPVEALGRHESWHAVDGKWGNSLSSELDRRITREKLREEAWKVGEYAQKNAHEMWAEVGTCRDMGIEIPEKIKSIFEEILEGMKKSEGR